MTDEKHDSDPADALDADAVGEASAPQRRGTTMGTPFFGIGAMRSGTTWLYHLLNQHPDCAVMPVKELHFFDAKYGIGEGDRSHLIRANHLALVARAASRTLVKAIGRLAPELSAPDEVVRRIPKRRWPDVERRRAFDKVHLKSQLRRLSALSEWFTITDTESYVAYLTRHGAGAAAFGEITPGYALLPAQGFTKMNQLFPNSVFIFIMRDPVERFWSNVRLAGKRVGDHFDPNAEFASYLSDNPLAQSMYHQTIATLESVIPKERILYVFHERLTSEDTGMVEVARIRKLLGLKPTKLPKDIFNTLRNASPPAAISEENEVKALAALAPTYRYVRERFGPVKGWRRPKMTEGQSA